MFVEAKNKKKVIEIAKSVKRAGFLVIYNSLYSSLKYLYRISTTGNGHLFKRGV